jgi:hypothetical protein
MNVSGSEVEKIYDEFSTALVLFFTALTIENLYLLFKKIEQQF